jgi:hypothetical protein
VSEAQNSSLTLRVIKENSLKFTNQKNFHPPFFSTD